LDLLVALGLLALISGWLTLLLLVLGGSTTLAIRIFTKRIRLMSLDSENASRMAATHFLETLYGIRLVKQGGQEKRVNRNYRELAWNRESTVLRLGNFREFSGSFIRFGGLIVVVLAAIGANLLSGLNILANVGLGIGYLYLAMRVSGSFNKVQDLWVKISTIMPQFYLVADFLLDDTFVEDAVDKNMPSIVSINNHVSVKDLSFSYQIDKGILKGVSLGFPKGSITA